MEEDYKKKYEDALGTIKKIKEDNRDNKELVDFIEHKYPEFQESEDEKIRKELIERVKETPACIGFNDKNAVLAWLEKQEPIDKEKVLIGARKNIALSIMNFLDSNTLGMCLSNMECKDLEDAVVDSDWSKVYKYMKKKLEKQGEQKQNSDLENYFTTTTKEQQKKDWNEIKDWEKKYFNHDRNIEQKPADKVEPKFRKGDWVVNDNGEIAHIVKVGNDLYGTLRYYIEWSNGNKSDPMPCFVDNDFHLWTIQDAKDGEVLATKDGCICIFNGSITEDLYPYAHGGLTQYGFKVFDETLPFTFRNVYPAIKEQRDLLFQKMKEAGYEWDSEKKELRKIEQKPSWSEEDEKYISSIIKMVEHCGFSSISGINKEASIDWLKSLKEIVQPTTTWKPSEER